jgi:hypothetical protein
LDNDDLFGFGLREFDLSFTEEHGARATLEWVEIAQIHQSEAETPLLVVLLAKRGLSGGAIGSGKSCRRNWRRGQLEMGGCRKERRRKSENTALAAQSAEVGRLPEGTPKKEREYRFIGGHKKGGSDTMLNILYRAEEGEREKRESGSQQWTTLYYIEI